MKNGGSSPKGSCLFLGQMEWERNSTSWIDQIPQLRHLNDPAIFRAGRWGAGISPQWKFVGEETKKSPNLGVTFCHVNLPMIDLIRPRGVASLGKYAFFVPEQVA